MRSRKTQIKTQTSIDVQRVICRRPSTKFKSSSCETALSAGETCAPSEANSLSPRIALNLKASTKG